MKKVINEHVITYNNIAKQLKKVKHIEQLMINLELIDEKKMVFSMKELI